MNQCEYYLSFLIWISISWNEVRQPKKCTFRYFLAQGLWTLVLWLEKTRTFAILWGLGFKCITFSVDLLTYKHMWHMAPSLSLSLSPTHPLAQTLAHTRTRNQSITHTQILLSQSPKTQVCCDCPSYILDVTRDNSYFRENS